LGRSVDSQSPEGSAKEVARARPDHRITLSHPIILLVDRAQRLISDHWGVLIGEGLARAGTILDPALQMHARSKKKPPGQQQGMAELDRRRAEDRREGREERRALAESVREIREADREAAEQARVSAETAREDSRHSAMNLAAAQAEHARMQEDATDLRRLLERAQEEAAELRRLTDEVRQTLQEYQRRLGDG
jgi:chromosome segregation ATPase